MQIDRNNDFSIALPRNQNIECARLRINMRNVVRTLLIGAVFLRFISSAVAQLATAYVVADQTTGYILDAYKAETKRQVASLTKIATGKVVLDWAAKTGTDLAQLVVVPQQAIME